MSHTKISAALSSRLQALPSSPPVAWENAGYTPVEGETFLAEHYLPASTTGVGVSADSSIDYPGVYQIDVRVPANEYKAEGNALADKVASHFKRGTVMTRDGQSVVVESVSRNQGLRDGAWWMIAVSVNWRAFGGNV